MALKQIIPFTSKEGHQYLIEFFVANELVILPEAIGINISTVAITLVDGEGINNASTLFQISRIIKAYLDENDVVLYCYCDNKEISRRQNKSEMLPQEYRSLLFSSMFNKIGNDSYTNHTIVINDETNGNHFIHLIALKSNQKHIETIENELLKLHK